MSIDSSARVDPSAEIADDAVIGPWCLIGPGVSIGSETILEANVHIRANTRIGRNNRIFQFSSVGEEPADKKYLGEDTWLEIGDDNVFREGVTLHRGTAVGGGVTRIGNGNLMMPYVHVAHDCIVGDNVVFANNVGISGHVEVGDWVVMGGYAGVNQFIKIGDHAFIGGMTHVDKDVPAYVIVSGQPAAVRAINAIGLERRGFDKDSIARIREAFKVIYRRQLSLQEAIDQLATRQASEPELAVLVDSLQRAERGIQR